MTDTKKIEDPYIRCDRGLRYVFSLDEPGHWYGRTVLAVIQGACPILWRLTVLIGCVAISILRFFCCYCSPTKPKASPLDPTSAEEEAIKKIIDEQKLEWKPGLLSVDAAAQMMEANSEKAVKVNRYLEAQKIKKLGLSYKVSDVFASIAEINASIKDQISTALACSFSKAQKPGPRPMQDDHFVNEKRDMAGVYDGFGGVEAAIHSRKKMENFEPGENIYSAFEYLFDDCQKSATIYKKQNSTALLCHIKENDIYTAAVGNSGVGFIVRQFPSGRKFIPISYNPDWRYPEVAKRVVAVQAKNNRFDRDWLKVARRKKPQAGEKKRFPSFGPEESCSIGDHRLSGINGENFDAALSHEPKIVKTRILPGDLVLLITDGITDKISLYDLIKVIKNALDKGIADIARHLVNDVDANHKLSDNATVVAIKVNEATC